MSEDVGLVEAFSALKHRNYRLFWFGQCISVIGTWMQTIAQSWLVLQVTNSAFWLGVVSAVQFLPMMFFSLHAGTLIDRVSKRKVLILTQTSQAILALILAIDVFWGKVTLWHIIVLAGALGLINTLDMPSRQAFMVELVGKKDLMNAIVLNSTIFNIARIIGPSLGGLAIAKFGIGICFFLNAVSFVPVIIGIILIRLEEIKGLKRRRGENILSEIKTGLKYISNTPGILITMILLAVVNILALNFNVIVPLLASNVYNVDAGGFGLLMGANGVGAVMASGVLAAKSRKGPKMQTLIIAAVFLCTFEILIASLRNLTAAYILLGIVGIASITFMTTANTLIQTQCPNNLRGRIMSVYTFIFGGLTPIGNFLTGSLAHLVGSPLTLAIEAYACLVLVIIVVAKNHNTIKTIRISQN